MQITTLDWLKVKGETRTKLRDIFLIPQSGMTEVETDQYGKSHIKSDGHTNVDLQVLTVEKMRDFLGTAASDETVYDLFKKVLEKVESPITFDNTTATQEPVNIPIDVPSATITVNIASDQLKCDQCPYETGNKRALTAHKTFKHKKAKP